MFKALENQKFLEQQEKAKKLADKPSISTTEPDNAQGRVNETHQEKTAQEKAAPSVAIDALPISSENLAVEKSSAAEQTSTSSKTMY